MQTILPMMSVVLAKVQTQFQTAENVSEKIQTVLSPTGNVFDKVLTVLSPTGILIDERRLELPQKRVLTVGLQ